MFQLPLNSNNLKSQNHPKGLKSKNFKMNTPVLVFYSGLNNWEK